MEQEDENLSMQLVESTSMFSRVINKNCSFDGSNIIYLSGTSIVFHNVFQNTKTFMERASDQPVAALAFHRSADTSIAIATRSSTGSLGLEFYFYGKKPIVVEVAGEAEVIDLAFLQKKKVALLVTEGERGALFIVGIHKKVRKVELVQRPYKFSCNQRRLLILFEKGWSEFITERQILGPRRNQQRNILDVLLGQNESEIVVDTQGNLTYGGKNVTLGSLIEGSGEYGVAVRVGRQILVAYKNELALTCIQLGEKAVEVVGRWEYSEKIKANIVSIECSLDEMSIALVVQVFHKEGFRLQHFLFNVSAVSSYKKFVSPFFRLTPNGADVGDVSCLQKIISSEIYYLAGPSIVNYSYVENIEKKHKYPVHQSPRLVAAHPLGHQLLCIFETHIKFYQKIELELVETWTEQLVCSAAKYSDTGALYLVIYQEGAHQVISYNVNNFRRIWEWGSIGIKQAAARLELDDAESELAVYTGRDLAVYRLRGGEKVSQFREKRQLVETSAVEYDPIRKCLLACSKGNLLICRKIQEYCLHFSNQKVVWMGQEITCIYIRQTLQSILFGTSDGKLLYAPYPLQLHDEIVDDQKVTRLAYKSIRIHSLPISDLLLTNNSKYLFASIKGDGLNILKIKRGAGKAGSGPYDISNYNFIQTSSRPYLQGIQEKLKILLQKRKTIFNQLDEYKKQWQGKRQAQTALLTTHNKRQQLKNINDTLAEINRATFLRDSLAEELRRLHLDAQKQTNTEQLAHHSRLLVTYKQADQLGQKKTIISQKCRIQLQQTANACSQNLQQIGEELEVKFRSFQTNFMRMKDNLCRFERRLEIQEEEEKEVGREQMEQAREQLRNQQEVLYRLNNELKGQITRNKKELERFLTRRDFLQNKRRFFVEQVRYCEVEKGQLLQVKQTLEEELNQLQVLTHKKEKRLRKYFIQNEILIKYQYIHDNLVKTSDREIEFLEEERSKLAHHINKLQKEIVIIAQQKERLEKGVVDREKRLFQAKSARKDAKLKHEYIHVLIKQVQDKIRQVNVSKSIGQEQKVKEYINIYNKFYLQKQLESYLSRYQKVKESGINNQNKRQEQKIREELHGHKDYLVKNMNLFEKYNRKVIDEINLSYLKYQTENYNLISECNIRKEQITKKKRILHELVDSLRETSNYINDLHSPHHFHQSSAPSLHQSKSIPFVAYQKQMEEQRQILKKQKQAHSKERTESTLWKIKKSSYQVRKMLEVQKLKGPDGEGKLQRRIKTAMIKKRDQTTHNHELADESMDVINPINYFIEPKKPMTAHRYRKTKQNLEARRIFSRNKSSSKPTTCTSYTKSKGSLFI